MMPIDQAMRRESYLRWFDALNARNLERLEELAGTWISEDFVTHDPGVPDAAPGPAAVMAFVRQLVSQNSSIDITLDDFFGEGDKTAARFTVLRTSGATGQTRRFTILALDHWRGEQLVEEWQLAGPPEAPA